MALNYAALDIRGKAVEPILEQIYFSNNTIKNDYVTFNDNIKAGTIFTEAGVTVTAQLYTGQALTSQGSIDVTDRMITPIKLEYKQTFLQEALRNSRFNTTMKGGAWEIESSEFGSAVLAQFGPAISQDAENMFWSGISAATKTAIAGLTAGAGQGSMTAATQTAVAAMTATPIDGVISRVLYDQSAVGKYIKVAGTTITSANIAAEYAKIYAAIPAEHLADTLSPVYFYAPRNHRQLMRIANNSVGAAQQINFDFESSANDSKVFYNGVEIAFVPMPERYVYVQKKDAISWNTDLVDDINKFEVNKLQADADVQFVRSIYTLVANVGRAAKGVLYNG
ncbi:hypothetical protein [Flavobacterium chungangensis]|uniref:Major capsid protein n=1 Tax=Flavobacterium chungangensis TaxID=2708132 RepID=A0ABV8ZBG2_9FLAO